MTAARRLSALGLACLLLAGCGADVAGTAMGNVDAARKATADAYQHGIEAFESYFGGLHDEHAKVYNYASYAGSKRGAEFESYRVGDPVSVLERKRWQDASDDTLYLHLAGTELDYSKLDTAHSSLAPTPWVSTPTRFTSDIPSTCIVITAFVACHLDEAIAQTKLEEGDRQPHEVHTKPDGSAQLVTGATLGQLMDKGLAVREDLQSQVTADMKATMVPITIDFGPGWAFTGFDVRATIPGSPTTLEFQFGYETAGRATKDDIPAAPTTGVTAITDEPATQKFFADLGKPADG